MRTNRNIGNKRIEPSDEVLKALARCVPAAAHRTGNVFGSWVRRCLRLIGRIEPSDEVLKALARCVPAAAHRTGIFSGAGLGARGGWLKGGVDDDAAVNDDEAAVSDDDAAVKVVF